MLDFGLLHKILYGTEAVSVTQTPEPTSIKLELPIVGSMWGTATPAMTELQQQLSAVRDEAAKFFTDIGATYPAKEGAALLELLSLEDKERRENIRRKLGHLAGRIAAAFREAPALGEGAVRTLQREVRCMEAALRFQQREEWGETVLYEEDRAAGRRDAGEFENPVPASIAQSYFQEAVEKILGLLSFALPDSEHATSEPEKLHAGTFRRQARRKAWAKARSRRRTASRRNRGELWRELALRENLKKICERLDEAMVPISRRWPKNLGCDSWSDCVYADRGRVIKAIEYRLQQARQ